MVIVVILLGLLVVINVILFMTTDSYFISDYSINGY